MAFNNSITQWWHELVYEIADPRTRDKPLMGSPFIVMGIGLLYVFVIKVVLTRFMADRKAFNTRWLSFVYNVYLLTTSTYFFYKACSLGWLVGYNWRCEPVDRSNSPRAIAIVDTCYAFLLLKLTYTLETVVFMLGKKFVLVTKYHVFHHATLPLLIWMGVNYVPGGHATFFAFVNSLTHMILFSYFTVVTAFPALKDYVTWWRSAFNWLHIVQFAILIIHGGQLFFWNPCNFEANFIVIAAIIYALCLTALYLGSRL